MAWREYVDPTDGSTWTTDDAGNFLPGSLADNGVGAPSGNARTTTPGGGGSGFPSMVGGTGQLAPYLSGIDKDLARDVYGNIQLPGFQWGQQQDMWNRALQMSNLGGYMPSSNMWGGMQQGASGGAPSGSYNTKNGPKTLQQMEAELRAAGWGGGEDVATTYARTIGGQVTPGGGGGGQGAGGGGQEAGGNWYQGMVDWYDTFKKTNNRPPNKDEWGSAFGQLTGASPETASQMYDKGLNYVRTFGQRGSPEEQAEWLRKLQPGLGQTRTLPGQMFDASKQQWQDTFDRSGTQWDKMFDRSGTQWDQTFGEDRRRFDTTASGWMGGEQGKGATLDRERMSGDLLSRLSGPQDWVKYQIAQSGMPEGSLGSLADVFKRTPSFGAAVPTESYEQKMAQLYANLKQGGQQGSGDYNILPMPGAVPLDERLLEQNFLPQQIPGRPDTGPRPGQTAGGNTTQFQPNMLANMSPGVVKPVPEWNTQVQPKQDMWQGMQQGAAQRQDPSGRYKPPAITDTDRAYNDAYSQAQRANEGRSDDMFRSAPPGWQQGQPTLQGRYNQGQQAPGRPGYLGPPKPVEQQSYMDLARELGKRHPTQIGAQKFNKMTPTQKAMQTGAWQDQGLDATDMWDKVQKALPKGQANTRTVWR